METLVNMKRYFNVYPRYFGENIYDIGSNTYEYRSHPSQNYDLREIFKGSNIITVDIKSDDKWIEMGEKHIVSDALNMRNIPFDTCEGILCCELLEHVIDPIRVIFECFRILKSGYGMIVSSLWLYPIHDPENDFLRYTDVGLKKIMHHVGLGNVETFYETIQDEPDWKKNSSHCSAGLTKRIGVFGFGMK